MRAVGALRMSLSPLTFTGVSSLSSELQTVLDRAVGIASIPLQRLQNQDADTLSRKTLLSDMVGPLTNLGNAVTSLGSIAAKKAIAPKSSNAAKVSVINTGASSAAVYSITRITSIARAATETSIVSYATAEQTAVSANGSMRLTVGTQQYNFTLVANNLKGLRDHINGLNAGVTASILTTAGVNYLSISSNATGATTLKLTDDPTGTPAELLTAANQGDNADFYLNGIHITRASNMVGDVVSGVSFTILGTTDPLVPSEKIDITLASDRSQVSFAIESFVAAYNSVVEKVNAQVGPNAGLLAGDFLVRQVQQNLKTVSGYEASGTIKSLADLGLEFDLTGRIEFDLNRFNGLTDEQVQGAFDYFGSPTSGFGALARKFTQLTDPITGLIRIQQDSYDRTDRRLQKEMADLIDRIDAMRKSVAARLQLADSLLAQLESQQKTIDVSIKSFNYVLYGKEKGS